MANHGWIEYCSRSLNRSRILKFEELPDPDPDPKILEQERSRSLKKWLRTRLPLPQTERVGFSSGVDVDQRCTGAGVLKNFENRSCLKLLSFM